MNSAAVDVELPPWVCTPTGGDPLTLPVLVVNRVFQPIRITSARRAIRLLYTGTARALTEEGDLLDFGAWLRLPVRERGNTWSMSSSRTGRRLEQYWQV